MTNPQPPLDLEIVHEFVVVAHGKFDRVQELLEQEPGLINSAWDWGAGDWETGLGAAAHMGRHDIAEYLLQRGAHLDLFAAAMLGKLEIVKAAITDNPNIIRVKGPHGISLLAHAQAGGDRAIAVLKLLEDQPEA